MQMLSRHAIRPALFALAAGAFSSGHAAVAYDESISGDLSNSGTSPTTVALAPGSNTIFGSTGLGGSSIDLDYFTVTIKPGQTLSGITVLPETSVGVTFSFLGVQAGPQVTVSPSAFTAVGLLGWIHYSNDDIST